MISNDTQPPRKTVTVVSTGTPGSANLRDALPPQRGRNGVPTQPSTDYEPGRDHDTLRATVQRKRNRHAPQHRSHPADLPDPAEPVDLDKLGDTNGQDADGHGHSDR